MRLCGFGSSTTLLIIVTVTVGSIAAIVVTNIIGHCYNSITKSIENFKIFGFDAAML